ncbi:hypothetical protein COU74_05305 [Candidatus Peregrinibacteria bacterium CG10_big_fil_rev_8_21_14_0_10_36_19]|nr:MAG: hypothetical protein COU74_05305 [Candidatus Peregrinibacteria bacterium CG10_big_fil_rev_8_21_14_0_10_36_19]
MSNQRFELSNRLFILLSAFTAALFIFWGFRIAEIYQNTTGSQPREIVVEAQGKAYVVPDVAQVNLGVNTKGPETVKIVEENTKKVNAIIKALTDKGIDSKDIQTVQYNLYENYKWLPNEGSKPDGYVLDQSILVKVRDIEKIGSIIDLASSNGATTIGNVSFIVDNPDAAKDEARNEAIKKAKIKALAIASEAGLKLSEVSNYYEYSGNDYYNGPQVYADTASLEKGGFGGGGSAEAAPSIQPGQQEVTLNVSLTYKLK